MGHNVHDDDDDLESVQMTLEMMHHWRSGVYWVYPLQPSSVAKSRQDLCFVRLFGRKKTTHFEFLQNELFFVLLEMIRLGIPSLNLF